jgi:hypothetical protein
MYKTRKQIKKGGVCPCAFQQSGGACPCQATNRLLPVTGGYKPTKRDKYYVNKWKKGKSIGFTMLSSLKSKGLLPRANGTRRVSAKYRHTK